MSFLHDDKVLAQLLYSLVKQGQDVSTAALAAKLVQQLEKQYAGVPDITSTTGAELKPENISNLSQLLQFLEANQVSINGKRLVYKDLASVPEGERDNYATPIPASVRDPATRKQSPNDYQVNLPLMTQYLKHLQQKGSKEDNRVLSLISGGLIDEYNQYNPESGLTRKPPSEPNSPNEMPDETVIDNFAYKLFDIHSVGQNTGGSIVLTARDLKSREALNAWLQGKVPGSGEEAKIVPYDAKGMPANPISYTANPCNVLRSMYTRAQQKLQLSKSPQETKAANFYLKKVQELSPTFTGPDGKSCQLTGMTATPGSPATQDDASQKGSGTAQENVVRIIEALPFVTRDIDFDRIEDFFKQVKQIKGADQQITSNIEAAERAMEEAARITNQRLFTLGLPAQQFMGYLNNKVTPAADFPRLLDKLSEILTLTQQVSSIFYNAAKRIKMLAPNQEAYILGQIGRSPTDNSIYARNINAIETLRNSVKRVQV